MEIKTKQQITRVTNDTSFTSQSFSIGDTGMVMEILRSKLYSQPIQTLVQEYTSNARDANREVNSQRPIEITLPTPEDPTFKVRDFGPGLSPDRMRDVFIQYGRSTKRGSNSQTGGYGIGAKSAWAYTDTFVIVTHVDGTSYHYVAHVTQDNAGSLDLISTVTSTEPNGTEIQIAIDTPEDAQTFIAAVTRAIEYWDVKEFPKVDMITRAVPLFSHGRLEVVQRIGDTALFAVVDGIPYPYHVERHSNALLDMLNLGGVVGLLHFKTGEIEVAANREAMSTSDANEKALEHACEDAVHAIHVHLKTELLSQTSLKDMIAKHRELQETFKIRNIFEGNFSGDVFQIEGNGNITGPLFDGTTRSYYSLPLYGHNKKLRTGSSDEIDFTKARILWTDDEVGQSFQNNRVRETLERMVGDKRLYILKGNPELPAFKRLAAHLGIEPTSSLGARTRKLVKRSTDADVIVNIYPSPTSRKTTAKVVNLDRNKNTYVYVRQSDTADYKTLSTFLESHGLEFALVSDTSIKRLEGKPLFVPLEDFARDYARYVPVDSQRSFIDALKVSLLKGNRGLLTISAALEGKGLKDSKLDQAINTLAALTLEDDIYDKKGVPRLAMGISEIIQGTPELADYAAQTDVLQEFYATYPLLTFVAGRSSIYDLPIEGTSVEDLVLYLNAAYERNTK